MSQEQAYISHDEFKAQLLDAPRISSLSEEFEAIAAGRKGRPVRPVPLDHDLLGNDALVCGFGETMTSLGGYFEEHIAGSIPWMREERARHGAGILLYGMDIAHKQRRAAQIYTSSSAEATLARTIASFSYGRINTVSCSPTTANQRSFYTFAVPYNANFFLGPYFDVTPTELKQRGMPQFNDGVDVVVEETTFQMYHKNRADQIGLIKRNLKPGGILMMVEKLGQESPEAFAARERQKDEQFKPLYFETDQIAQKRQTIVSKMNGLLVTMDELADAAKQHFNAAVVTFNSGNFYSIAASDDPENLAAFVGTMIAPAVPPEYVYDDVPKVLFGPPGARYEFADPRTTLGDTPWQQHLARRTANMWENFGVNPTPPTNESKRDLARLVAYRMVVKHALMEREKTMV